MNNPAGRKDPNKTIRWVFNIGSWGFLFSGAFVILSHIFAISIIIFFRREMPRFSLGEVETMFIGMFMFLNGLIIRPGSRINAPSVLKFILGVFGAGFCVLMIRAHFLFYLLGFISSVIMVITSFRKVPDKLRLSEKNETRLVIVMIVLGF